MGRPERKGARKGGAQGVRGRQRERVWIRAKEWKRARVG